MICQVFLCIVRMSTITNIRQGGASPSPTDGRLPRKKAEPTCGSAAGHYLYKETKIFSQQVI
jgi:hypothetical protein